MPYCCVICIDSSIVNLPTIAFGGHHMFFSRADVNIRINKDRIYVTFVRKWPDCI